MFNHRRLLLEAVELPTIDVASAEGFAQQTVNKVRGRVVRARGHSVQGQGVIRLCQDSAGFEALRNELLLNSGGHKVAAAVHATALRELFLAPACVVPITTALGDPNDSRTVVLLGFFRAGNTAPVSMLRSFVRTSPADRKGIVNISALNCEWFLAPEDQMLELESVFRLADPRTRSAIHSVPGWPRQAFWIGGSRSEPSNLPDDWKLQIRAVGAVRGLEIEVLEEPYRRLAEVLRAIRERRPDSVLVWDPYMSTTAERIVQEFEEVMEDGIEIRIDQGDLEDALVLARLELDEALARWEVEQPGGNNAAEQPVLPPAAGEERYYRKHHGSAIGDIMVRRDDCEHDRWESTNKAPRAWKGIERMENVSPQVLFRCMRGGCKRWRARF